MEFKILKNYWRKNILKKYLIKKEYWKKDSLKKIKMKDGEKKEKLKKRKRRKKIISTYEEETKKLYLRNIKKYLKIILKETNK